MATVTSRPPRNHPELFDATETGNERRLREILAKKCDVNAVNKQGNTTLHRACANSDFNIVRLLVDHGADPNRRGKCGFTCLHMATQHSDNKALMSYLVKRGADAYARADMGETILHTAATTGNVAGMEFALECGIDVNAKGCSSSGSLLAAKYLNDGPGHGGFTAIHNLAGGCLKLAAFEFLKRKGVNLSAKDDAGWNMLHCAARSKNLVAIHFGIMNGVDVSGKSKAGKSVSDVALEYGASEEIMRNLKSEEDSSLKIADSSSAQLYPISPGGPRGIMLIINNKNFKEKNLNLAATERDTSALKRAFHKLGFTIIQKEDLRGDEMFQEMRSALHRVRHDHDMFVCTMISHGHLGEILGADGTKVDLKKLVALANSKNCSTLKGKPKVFFIEACQGEDDQPMAKNWEFSLDATASFSFAASNSVASFDHEDFFIGMSCTEGYVSFRDTDRGSSYIQSLCRSLQVNSRWEINDIHKEVVASVVKFRRQTPQTRSTLTKKLFFEQPYNTSRGIMEIKNKASSYDRIDQITAKAPPPSPRVPFSFERLPQLPSIPLPVRARQGQDRKEIVIGRSSSASGLDGESSHRLSRFLRK